MHYPRHIAIIPDGNRTRAKEHWLDDIEWHLKGIDISTELSKYIFTQTPIEVMTGWWLSTENIANRSSEYIANLCQLFIVKGDLMNEFLQEHRINFRRIWSPVWLPWDFVEHMLNKQKIFSYEDSAKTIIFAINYGWRDEIMRGIRTLIDRAWDIQTLKTNLTDISLWSAMDLWSYPPIELVIRTKGNLAHRTSGFMSRWIGYAELYFTDTKYPDFDTSELKHALERYNQVYMYRNFGK